MKKRAQVEHNSLEIKNRIFLLPVHQFTKNIAHIFGSYERANKG